MRRRCMSRIDSSVGPRSEEHTSELQSRFDLVCRLLLEKKKKILSYFLLSKIKTIKRFLSLFSSFLIIISLSIHFFYFFFFFFFNDTATTEIYTLSLHDALPILGRASRGCTDPVATAVFPARCARARRRRSEEHTSELQSRLDLVGRLLLEKKQAAGSVPRIRKQKTQSNMQSNRT